jgi:hypothetical protein
MPCKHLEKSLKRFCFKIKKVEIMEKRMSMIFHARKSKATKGNLVPIYLRVTIGGQRCELTTKQLISEEKWSAHTGEVKGTSFEAKSINSFLDTLQGKAHAIHRAIIQESKTIFSKENLHFIFPLALLFLTNFKFLIWFFILNRSRNRIWQLYQIKFFYC